MSHGPDDRVSRNIDLAFRLLEEAIDDPSRLDEVPDGATVVPLPPDDPELAAENFATAVRLHEGGRDVRMYRLGAPAGERAVFTYRTVSPRWPTEGINPVVEYDRVQDTLVVDFFRGRRQGIEIPAGEFGLLFVDPATEEVVANVLPGFLARAVRRDPTLIDVLLRPETALRGITRGQVAEIRRSLVRDHRLPEAPPASFGTITARLELLTA